MLLHRDVHDVNVTICSRASHGAASCGFQGRVLGGEGLEAKLVFGSHAPLFIPYAALGRVVTDLDDEATEAILNGNALRFLSGG